MLEQLLAQPDFLIRRAHQLAAAAFAEACADLDLTSSQYAALFALRQRRTVSQNELGRLIALDRSTTSVVLRTLKDRGLVATGHDGHDRRKLLLSLTDAGRLLLAQAETRNARSNAAWLAALGDEQSAQLLALLRQVATRPK